VAVKKPPLAGGGLNLEPLLLDLVEISSWMKVQDFSRHSTYTLAFKANRAVPVNRHRIEVRVKRQNAQLRYPALLAY
jgi:hypothetical protein